MADLVQSKESAQVALFVAITEQVANLSKITSTAARADALAQLALAYRYAAGGAQPGSVTVEK